jgi:hypothetical protein
MKENKRRKKNYFLILSFSRRESGRYLYIELKRNIKRGENSIS